ncbi:hypothetical protein XANCAGTX0491_005285 [Xanthoria calcicola]
MQGEFESMTAIRAVSPTFAPKPTAWGTFKTNPDLHFFLCDFHHMDPETPNASTLTARLAEMHKKSISPNGKYGFHLTTYNGNLPQDCTWTDTWEECYRNNLKRMFDLEEEARGSDGDFRELRDTVLDKAVTRLLRPLESEGRSIKPCLVHGDLWSGNVATDIETGEPIVFDASALYAHNEYEVRTMRANRRFFGRSYLKSYHDYYPISEPVDEHDARLALYGV